jgi:tetratricopeptide (TPR) repeat protein
LFSKGFFKRAQELLEKSLQVLKEIYQDQDRPEMATVIYNIAHQLLKQGAYDQALQQCSKALNLYKKVCYFLQK